MIPHWKNKSLSNLTTVREGVLYVEEWRHIPDFPEFFLISSFGRLKRVKSVLDNSKRNFRRRHITTIKETILTQCLNRKGYPRVDLCWDKNKISRAAHRLVGLAFLPMPFGGQTQINHKIPDKTDNHYTNLEWCTNSENQLHANVNKLRKIPVLGEHALAKWVLNIETGIFYDCAKSAYLSSGIKLKYESFAGKIRSGKTKFIYV